MWRVASLSVVGFGLVACGGSGGESATDGDGLEATVASDIAELGVNVGDIAAGGAALPDDANARATTQQCYATWGGCQLCFDLEGGPLSGVFAAGLDQATCTASRTGRVGELTYTVTEALIEGDFAGNLVGDYAVSATGSRAAELTYEGRRADRSWDSSFTLNRLDATTTQYAVATLEVDLTYTGFGGHVWEVEVAGVPGDMTGTVTADNGDSCAVAGSLDDLAVSCAD